jgi:hypothetical protein
MEPTSNRRPPLAAGQDAAGVDRVPASRIRPNGPLAAVLKRDRKLTADLGRLLSAALGDVLGPLVAHSYLGGARSWGFIVAAYAAGAVAGGLVMARFRPRRLLAAALPSLPAFSLALFALAVPLTVPLDIAAAVLAGGCLEVFTVSWATTMQQEIPPSKLSRVASYDALGNYALTPSTLPSPTRSPPPSAPGPCPGRPLSETVIANLAAALDKSPLADTLSRLTSLVSAGIYRTQRRGRPNTSGTATLVWQVASGTVTPFEMTCRIVAPDQYGHSHIQTLNISIEVISRLTSWWSSSGAQLPIPPGTVRRLEPAEWTALLEALISTLVDPSIIAAIADLADVDPILVPQPGNLHLVSAQEIAGFLPPLPSIPGAGGARGSHLRADPALSLSDPGGPGHPGKALALPDRRRRRAYQHGRTYAVLAGQQPAAIRYRDSSTRASGLLAVRTP